MRGFCDRSFNDSTGFGESMSGHLGALPIRHWRLRYSNGGEMSLFVGISAMTSCGFQVSRCGRDNLSGAESWRGLANANSDRAAVCHRLFAGSILRRRFSFGIHSSATLFGVLLGHFFFFLRQNLPGRQERPRFLSATDSIVANKWGNKSVTTSFVLQWFNYSLQDFENR